MNQQNVYQRQDSVHLLSLQPVHPSARQSEDSYMSASSTTLRGLHTGAAHGPGRYG